MDFCLLLEILVKIYVANIVKNLLIVLKKPTTDTIKTVSKRAIKKTAETAGDLIDNKIADKITKTSNTAKKVEAKNTELNKEIPKE